MVPVLLISNLCTRKLNGPTRIYTYSTDSFWKIISADDNVTKRELIRSINFILMNVTRELE